MQYIDDSVPVNAPSNDGQSSVAIIILTSNEQLHIRRCIENALCISPEIHIVDSFSTDETVAIAESMGAHVRRNVFVNHATQFEWALKNIETKAHWLVRMDADELFDLEAQRDILSLTRSASSSINGFFVKRFVVFSGSIIRFGGMPHWVLRVWRRGFAQIEDRWMDEHMVLTSGQSIRLTGRLLDVNLNPIGWWIQKHNGYASREAIDLLNQKHKFLRASNNALRPSRQPGRKRLLKEVVYTRLPKSLRSGLFFFYRVIFRFGFLDGRTGLLYHFLQGYWYRLLVDIKIREVEAAMAADSIDCPAAIEKILKIKLS